MNPVFLQRISATLATERLDAYRQDGVAQEVALARYLLNMALCEALYSPLQLSEVALRNALHACLAARYGSEAWYDSSAVPLALWQQAKIAEAKQQLTSQGKTATPGRVVAELSFGFWTALFNKSQARTGLGHHLVKNAFPHARRTERDLARLDAKWEEIRSLRNRVFHHERIVHWADLEARHRAILDVIGWISPELLELATALDRFSSIRRDGLMPWLEKIKAHWPHPDAPPPGPAA
jgi:hypothetical protein